MNSNQLLVLGLLLGAASCNGAPAVGSLTLVAHRGASHIAPENTIAAFQQAWKERADAIEGDFYLSADGVVVCHHDASTKKTAGVDRRVGEQTLAELQLLDVGSWKGDRWADERIPTLEQVLATVPTSKTLLIELKGDAQMLPAVARVVETSSLAAEQLTVIAFDPDVIAASKQRLPAIKALWLSGFEEEEEGSGVWTPGVEELIATAQRVGADGVDLNANLAVLDEPFVASLRAAGLEFHAWTVNDPAVARRLIELGVDSITTDRPGGLRTALETAVAD